MGFNQIHDYILSQIRFVSIRTIITIIYLGNSRGVEFEPIHMLRYLLAHSPFLLSSKNQCVHANFIHSMNYYAMRGRKCPVETRKLGDVAFTTFL